MTATATTEEVLHAAILAGDFAAYAALEDFYLEAGATDAARAVGHLARAGGQWPLGGPIQVKSGPEPIAYSFANAAKGEMILPAWDRSKLDGGAFNALFRLLGDPPDSTDYDWRWDSHSHWEGDALPWARPGRWWVYFTSIRQALDHLGRVLEGMKGDGSDDHD